MKRLILTSTDSGAGCLKASRIADKVIGLRLDLVYGPAPFTSDPTEFSSARAALLGADWEHDVDAVMSAQSWQDLATTARDFERVEMWVDPDCNSQLQLIQFLDWARSYPEIVSKLALVHGDVSWGGRTPEDVAAINPTLQSVGDHQLEAAELAWRAYRQPTPEAWYALPQTLLAALPQLSGTVVRLLEELPASDTALGATQLKLLETISSGAQGPMEVIADYLRDDRRVFRYWPLGKMLDRLAQCPRPPLLGLDEGPFTLAMHDDKARYERYRRSTLSLTELGKALLAGNDDYSRHNPIDRWWGGTKLDNDRLWRWNMRTGVLVVPPS